LCDEEVQARAVELLALQRFVESGAWGAESPTAPLVDLGDPWADRLIVVN
jgi:hypothetical protein